MRIEIIERDLPKGGSFISLVNLHTRKYIGQLGPHDNFFNANRIKEALDLYQDLMDAGLLNKVLAALAKHKSSEQPEQQK